MFLDGSQRLMPPSSTCRNAGVVIPKIPQFNSPIWPMKKIDGSWRMMDDYHKLDQMVTSTGAAVPDMISLFEEIITSPGIWYSVIDLSYAFFSIYIHKGHQKQFSFNWQDH